MGEKLGDNLPLWKRIESLKEKMADLDRQIESGLLEDQISVILIEGLVQRRELIRKQINHLLEPR